MIRRLVAGLVALATVATTSVAVVPSATALVPPVINLNGTFCGYLDVPYDSYYTSGACWMQQQGVATKGTAYNPNNSVTRAQMASFLWRLNGSPAAPDHVFADEASIAWQVRPATDWLYATGITTNDPYNPNGSVSRAEMAAFLWRYSTSPAAPNHVFADEASIPAYAKVATDWLFAQGITTNDPYSPSSLVTRAQMAAFLYRMKGSPALSADTMKNTSGSHMVLWFDSTITTGNDVRVILQDEAGTGVSATIDWGDGNAPVSASAAGVFKHTYPGPGYYRVLISGTVGRFTQTLTDDPAGGHMPEIGKLVAVSSFGTLGLKSLRAGFFGAWNLRRVPRNLPSTVTNIAYMFSGPDFGTGNEGAKAFNDPEVINWNTTNVTGMAGVFEGTKKFNQPIGKWNTANVYDMSYMFKDALAFNQNLLAWNTDKVSFALQFKYGSPLTNENVPPKLRDYN